jgi:hypothetical protein
MSYPRPWRGKARADKGGGAAHALANGQFQKPRPHPEERAKPATRRMRAWDATRGSRGALALRDSLPGFLRVRVWVLASFWNGLEPGVFVNSFIGLETRT